MLTPVRCVVLISRKAVSGEAVCYSNKPGVSFVFSVVRLTVVIMVLNDGCDTNQPQH